MRVCHRVPMSLRSVLGEGAYLEPLGTRTSVMDFEVILKVAERRVKAALGKAEEGKI